MLGHRNRKSPSAYHIEDHGHDTPCWIWQRSQVGTTGYGKINRKGKTYRAHRLYYEQAFGPVPDGLQLDHLCRQKACVRPSHLEAVSPQTNVRRGPRTKLSTSIAGEIRAAYHNGGITQSDLAARYGVQQSVISLVLNGKRWD